MKVVLHKVSANFTISPSASFPPNVALVRICNTLAGLKQNEQDGITEYGKIYKDTNGYPLKPLKNEIISRDRMQTMPPHILVTNYAMLEYMMLRPKDDLVFSGAKLRFLVLDEAHIYRGATGMETSLLLKRLKARISNPANVLHILTSATLGGKEANHTKTLHPPVQQE